MLLAAVIRRHGQELPEDEMAVLKQFYTDRAANLIFKKLKARKAWRLNQQNEAVEKKAASPPKKGLGMPRAVLRKCEHGIAARVPASRASCLASRAH
jgi:hypothetical protein